MSRPGSTQSRPSNKKDDPLVALATLQKSTSIIDNDQLNQLHDLDLNMLGDEVGKETTMKAKVSAAEQQQDVAIINTAASSRFPNEWSSARRIAAQMATNVYFDITIGVIVLTNIGLIVHQSNLTGLDVEVSPTVGVLNFVFLWVYTLEAIVRLFAFRCAYFFSKWNQLDFAVLSVDWILVIVAWALAGTEFNSDLFRVLRVIRALRVLRSIRTLPLFRELYIMLYGFLSAAKAIAWAAVLLLLILMIMGIIAVEFIHPKTQLLAAANAFPVECTRCDRAFQTVWASALTFSQQIVAGDSWGQVTIPIMEEYPETVPYFILVFITIDLGLLNLILSVIVDKAHQAQQEDIKFQLTQRQAQFEGAKRQLLALCEALDEDRSGYISLDELLSGYDRLPEFQEQMRLMDVEREDMQSLFRVLDEDGSGDIAYTEFVEQVVKMRSQDTTLSLLFLRSQMKDLKHHLIEVTNSLGGLRTDVTSSQTLAPATPATTQLSEEHGPEQRRSRRAKMISVETQTDTAPVEEAQASRASHIDGGRTAWQSQVQSLKSAILELERLAPSNMAPESPGSPAAPLAIDAAARTAMPAEESSPFGFSQRCCQPRRPVNASELVKHSRV